MKKILFKALFYSFTLFLIGATFIPQALALDPVTQQTLNELNPLKVGNSEANGDFNTLGGVINRVLLFIFPLAVLILFLMLFWAGFEMFSGAADKGSVEKGKNRATMAIVGFILLFISYWLIQIIETVFGVVLISFT